MVLLTAPRCCKVREEIGAHLRASDVPDASIDKIVMDIDQRYEHKGIGLKSSARIIEDFIDPHEDKEAHGAQGQ